MPVRYPHAVSSVPPGSDLETAENGPSDVPGGVVPQPVNGPAAAVETHGESSMLAPTSLVAAAPEQAPVEI